MVAIVSSVLYLAGQKDLCSVMASIGKVLALVQEFFYRTQYVVVLYKSVFQIWSTIGDSACEALRNFKGAAFWILMLFLLEERMSMPCQ